MDYKTSGVDIEAGRSFVDQIKNTVKSTHRPEVLGGYGGFNGMTKIPAGYEKPVLVSGADGVGTKVHVAELNATGEIENHKANVEVYLEHPVGIGEHSDITEAIGEELDKI